jgi:hypothetical protein
MAKSRPGSESGYERAATVADEANQHSLLNGVDPAATPTATKPAVKPKRRMSTGLQVMAQIERKLNDLEPKVYNSVLAWLKTLDAKEIT